MEMSTRWNSLIWAGGLVALTASAAWAQLPATIDLNVTPGTESAEVTRVYGNDTGDALGRIAFGDINGDGFDDVILGAFAANTPGGYSAGEVVVVYGNASLPASAEVDLNTPPGTHGETRILGDDSPDQAGFSVAGGDVNGDGFDDVILGSRGASFPATPEAGELVVIYGSTSLPASAEIDLNSVHGDVRVLGDNAYDQFGHGGEVGGDVNRDGFADFAASAWGGDNPSIGGDNKSGVGYLIYGDGTAPSATVSQFSRTGDGVSPEVVPTTDFGPVVRCVIDFSDDDTADNGSAEASMTTVTLTRSDAGLNLASPEFVADVQWEITTNRVGWASAEVTFQFIDTEVPAMLEDSLVIQQAATAAGPFTPLPTTINALRNEATATVSSFSVFALTGETVPTGLNLLGAD